MPELVVPPMGGFVADPDHMRPGDLAFGLNLSYVDAWPQGRRGFGFVYDQLTKDQSGLQDGTNLDGPVVGLWRHLSDAGAEHKGLVGVEGTATRLQVMRGRNRAAMDPATFTLGTDATRYEVGRTLDAAQLNDSLYVVGPRLGRLSSRDVPMIRVQFGRRKVVVETVAYFDREVA